MMTLAAVTRYCICELLLLTLGTGDTQAQSARFDVRLASGWVENPFFDSTDLQAIAPIAGPFTRLRLGARFDTSTTPGHSVRVEASERLERYWGDADALAHHERLALGWRWRDDTLRAGVMIRGRYDAIDRFTTDARWTTEIGPDMRWQASDRVEVRASLSTGLRGFPERVDVDADGGAQLDERHTAAVGALFGPARLAATRWWLDVDASAWLINSNADGLDRNGFAGGGYLIGQWRSLFWEGFTSAWALTLPAQVRSDTGLQIGGALGVTLGGGFALRADYQRLDGLSDQASGRFAQWQTGLSVSYRGTWRADRPPRPVAGVYRLPDGRWRFTMRAPGATRVALVGDFNAWKIGATPMREDGDSWTVDISLPPGRHTYMFAVDGTLEPPRVGRTIEDDFGGRVGLLLVER